MWAAALTLTRKRGRIAPRELEVFGRRYIAETRIYRTGPAALHRQMPNNFSHVGLIGLILPHAAIIDVRRHPRMRASAPTSSISRKARHLLTILKT